MANLLDNALKYGQSKPNKPEEDEEILLRLVQSKGKTEISVSDCGPGIPQADRERVLHRFVRLESSRSEAGSGLGLSLAAAVVRLHGGLLRLEDNQECDKADHGPGLVVTISLPT